MTAQSLQGSIATPANMRRFAESHPGRDIQTPDGPAHVEGVRCVALDQSTGETFSASAGDYFTLADDQPLLGEDGEPMILVVPFSGYRDAFSGEVV